MNILNVFGARVHLNRIPGSRDKNSKDSEMMHALEIQCHPSIRGAELTSIRLVAFQSVVKTASSEDAQLVDFGAVSGNFRLSCGKLFHWPGLSRISFTTVPWVPFANERKNCISMEENREEKLFRLLLLLLLLLHFSPPPPTFPPPARPSRVLCPGTINSALLPLFLLFSFLFSILL